jgi:hypothetical protein
MTTKTTHGGTRQGSGRPPKYGEPTVRLQLAVPVSEAHKFRLFYENFKKEWENGTINQRSSKEL